MEDLAPEFKAASPVASKCYYEVGENVRKGDTPAATRNMIAAKLSPLMGRSLLDDPVTLRSLAILRARGPPPACDSDGSYKSTFTWSMVRPYVYEVLVVTRDLLVFGDFAWTKKRARPRNLKMDIIDSTDAATYLSVYVDNSDRMWPDTKLCSIYWILEGPKLSLTLQYPKLPPKTRAKLVGFVKALGEILGVPCVIED